jgi:hypothetical protein
METDVDVGAHSLLLTTRSERDRCLLFRVDASREGPVGIPQGMRISGLDAEALRPPLALWHPESAHPGTCWGITSINKKSSE